MSIHDENIPLADDDPQGKLFFQWHRIIIIVIVNEWNLGVNMQYICISASFAS